VVLSDDVIRANWFLALNEKHFGIDSKDIKTILVVLEVLRETQLTQAGFLCFADNISASPNAMIKLARFKGESPDVFIDMKNTTRNLIEAVNESLIFITRSINMKVEIGRQAERIEKWDYSVEALREGLINAVVHRDYSDPGNIQVRIFDSRIEIWSPGLFPRELDISRIETECRSIPRNKKIAEIFYRVDLIENWGTGFIRMLSQCKTNGNPRPKFEEKAGAFVITFFRALNEGINEGINELFQFIQRNQGLRINQISKRINVSSKTIEHWVSALKTSGKIEFRGSKKTGGYFLIENSTTK
jgi:ATP-dependent DNA helicase RecG